MHWIFQYYTIKIIYFKGLSKTFVLDWDEVLTSYISRSFEMNGPHRDNE
jgi:hypothetical protein